MHAMWNAGSEPGRIIEIIAPGGFENYFQSVIAPFCGLIDNLLRCAGEPQTARMVATASSNRQRVWSTQLRMGHCFPLPNTNAEDRATPAEQVQRRGGLCGDGRIAATSIGHTHAQPQPPDPRRRNIAALRLPGEPAN